MKKLNRTWMVVIAAVLLVAVAIPAVAAVTGALKPEQKKELEKLYNTMLDTQKQIIQKRVEFGQIDKTQGQYIIDRMELRRKYMDQWIDNGGMGMGPGGCGMQGGRMGRRGQPGMGPGWQNPPSQQNP